MQRTNRCRVALPDDDSVICSAPRVVLVACAGALQRATGWGTRAIHQCTSVACDCKYRMMAIMKEGVSPNLSVESVGLRCLLESCTVVGDQRDGPSRTYSLCERSPDSIDGGVWPFSIGGDEALHCCLHASEADDAVDEIEIAMLAGERSDTPPGGLSTIALAESSTRFLASLLWTPACHVPTDSYDITAGMIALARLRESAPCFWTRDLGNCRRCYVTGAPLSPPPATCSGLVAGL